MNGRGGKKAPRTKQLPTTRQAHLLAEALLHARAPQHDEGHTRVVRAHPVLCKGAKMCEP